jgi:hypothetical protein
MIDIGPNLTSILQGAGILIGLALWLWWMKD